MTSIGSQQIGSPNSCISKQEPQKYTAKAENFKLGNDDINGILTSWKEWGKDIYGRGVTGMASDPPTTNHSVFVVNSCGH